MGFIARSIKRRIRNHGLLAIATIATGGLAAPLHILVEKFHVVGDIADAAGALSDATPDVHAADAVSDATPDPSPIGTSSEPSFGAYGDYEPNEKYVNTQTGEERWGSQLQQDGHNGTHRSEEYPYNTYSDADSREDWEKKS